MADMAESENVTIRQLYERLAESYGKFTLRGSFIEVADTIQEWFTSQTCGGFIFQPPDLAGGLK